MRATLLVLAATFPLAAQDPVAPAPPAPAAPPLPAVESPEATALLDQGIAKMLAFGRGILDHALNLYAALALLYLLLPIAIIILFSFNDTHSRFNFTWQGFTLKSWQDPFGVPGIQEAMLNSLKIAVLATIIATILGTMMALALVRYQFRGRGATNLFIFIPLATPEVVLGASLLSLFLSIGGLL